MSDARCHQAISCDNSPHYRWGEACDGWRLLNRPDISIIEERVPPGLGEQRHRHAAARQFFYLLEGEASIAFDNHTVKLLAGQALEVPPGQWHRFHNHSETQDVRFLVISAPWTMGDRENEIE
ncbi:cupin domain-containing protein [Pseudomarimonas arenosa]|uniref:Cupin domain-containing protein n=1 Tax=Pseudomarimonas arenosa TaxID=2774145 RepID=A0AAW3ZMM1_9GAMM|nr:cupin domain-containing protein [Pseudomarimonas arenosa]MBD8526322.1 cupin domain-containing protein [Pseudomarimonas arenosa]